MFSEAYLYDGVRTPFGRHGGALAAVRPDDLMAEMIAALFARGPCNPADVEAVIIGSLMIDRA